MTIHTKKKLTLILNKSYIIWQPKTAVALHDINRLFNVKGFDEQDRWAYIPVVVNNDERNT